MNKKVFAVAAIGENNVLGKNGKLPWPEMKCDYERLLELAGDKPTIMGRNTYESPQNFLSKNHNLILTSHQLSNLPTNCSTVKSVEEALSFYEDEPEICILGGQQIYSTFLPFCTHLYITLIHTTENGDAYFPVISDLEWELTKRTNFHSGEGNPLDYEFLVYTRKELPSANR